jgi:hypothetical protein
VRPGQEFQVNAGGRVARVKCPPNTSPGQQIQIQIPIDPDASNGGGNNHPNTPDLRNDDDDAAPLFEVEVPPGVQPGQPFALSAGGVRVLVTCPNDATPGKMIRFKLPSALTQPKAAPTAETAQIRLNYDKGGWLRTVRATDLCFQWIRMDDNGDVDNYTRFDPEKSAYVRKLELEQGKSNSPRGGRVSLVQATEAVVAS